MPGFFKSIGNFFKGTPAKRENVSTLRPEQEGLYQQLVNAGMSQGAGGAFGGAADYYRNLLSDDSADYNAFAAPMLRQYQQDIVPGISEQFAGMGAGGLSSSGFRNAQMQGATDLAERLGAIRANLRQAGAQGLQNIGNLGLQRFSENMVTDPGSAGLFGNAGNALSSFLSPLSGKAFNWMSNSLGGTKVGRNTLPSFTSSSPSAIPQSYGLPRFGQGTRYGG